MAQIRWGKTTKAQRSEIGRRMNQARWGKKAKKKANKAEAA